MSLKTNGGWTPRRVLALADDLSGAAETAAVLGLRSRIVLRTVDAGRNSSAASADVTPWASSDESAAVVLDLDSRQLGPGPAARAVAEALRWGMRPHGMRAEGVVLLKKVDSLLRGNLATEAEAYAAQAAGVVIAPALPALGRTVQGGVVHLNGAPLHTTDAWRAEPRSAPHSVAAALDGLRTRVVPLAVVRAPLPELVAELHSCLALGYHPVCDTEADDDLDAIAQATLQLDSEVRLLGTGGLAAALGRQLTESEARQPGEWQSPGAPRPLLVVVGTAEPTAAAQIAHLVEEGARHITLPAEADAFDAADAFGATDVYGTAGASDITVLSLDNSAGVHPGSARRLVDALARAAAALGHGADLVLTGGETARRVLDALGVARLTPIGQIHHGAVHCLTPDGRSVVTRPGSFGGPDSLLRIAHALRPGAATRDDPNIPATRAN
ncbi:four-carbon acid sugar kinase family protein [Streptomyces sp. NPDC017993]|uniref:four-carbon acid sugar kinase family protein n=1 Tax=Streptomyces sp. NPDC017993 TaxID=3365027 RepID=UPI003794A30C